MMTIDLLLAECHCFIFFWSGLSGSSGVIVEDGSSEPTFLFSVIEFATSLTRRNEPSDSLFFVTLISLSAPPAVLGSSSLKVNSLKSKLKKVLSSDKEVYS